MVTEWIMTAVTRTIEWVVNSLPIPDLPADWLTTVQDFIATLNYYAGWFDAWVPWTVIGIAIPVIVLAWGVANAARIAMKLISYLTLGGGAT